MVMGRERQTNQGIDPTTLRLAIFGIAIVAAFVALFSRLWFLQVLAAPDYQKLAKENRVRFVHSEPPRGRIVDANGRVLVTNTVAIAVTVDRQALASLPRTHRKERIVIGRLAKLLKVKEWNLRQRMKDELVSPYKPVPVAQNVPRAARDYILENQEDFFNAVDIERVPIRIYPEGEIAAHVLGYIGEISPEQLKSPDFKGVRPPYKPGDVVGRSGLEYTYDRWLRGDPQVRKVIVNSSGDVLSDAEVREEDEGDDIVLSLDARIQRIAESALDNGILASRSAYQAPAGGVVVMDPTDGGIVAMASYPTYDPRIIADGLTQKEYNKLGAKTRGDPDDDAFLNRAIQAQRAPASTFKIVTAGAAMASGVASPYTVLPCPPSAPYPPEGVVETGASEIFNNWTTIDLGTMGFVQSLEQSCDTFYYELGWRMEDAFGEQYGDGSEKFQKYIRLAGVGHETGIDLPNEADGLVPDRRWCQQAWDDTKHLKTPTCGTKEDWIWLPGYTVNMAIGQGDLLATPIQMAVTTSAIANGGTVWRPHLVIETARPDDDDVEQPIKEFEPHARAELPLDDIELSVIREGMEDVVAGSAGTGRSAFYGFPLEAFPIAGKTGTSELDESTDLQDSWFVSYAPAEAPEYVVVVYVEKAGHGGETAAPIAREIYEGIFELDQETSVQLGQDESG